MADYDRSEAILPDNWIWTTLDVVADTTRQRRHPQEYPELPYIGLENVESETMRLLETQSASELKSMADYFQPGDVLYARLRPYLNKVFRPEFEGLCSSEFIIFRELENLSNKYLQYLINSWDFVSFAMSKITGDRPRVDMDDLGDYPFPLAPLDEQYRIVDEIEAQFSRLDTWFEVMHKLREQLPRLRASILKAAVEGRLVEQDPDDEPAEVLLQRILDERRRKWEEDYLADLEAKGKSAPKNDKRKEQYPQPIEPELDQLPELPDNWSWATLDQLSSHVTSGSRGWAKYYADKGDLFVRVGNFKEMEISLDLRDVVFVNPPDGAEGERTRLELNDLLITITAAVGMPAVVDESTLQWGNAYINQHVSLIRLLISELAHYVALVLTSEFGQKQVRDKTYGQVKDGLNLTDVKSLSIPFPPQAYQQAVVEDVSRRLSVIDRLETTIEVNINRAERMRQSILRKAFEGRLVEQDPNDEPASKLLARIREERQRRAEEDKQKPRQQRERKVSIQTERKSLYETLKEAGKPLLPETLFQRSGHKADSLEDVEDFYEELGHEIEASRIRQNASVDSLDVTLEAVDHAD